MIKHTAYATEITLARSAAIFRQQLPASFTYHTPVARENLIRTGLARPNPDRRAPKLPLSEKSPTSFGAQASAHGSGIQCTTLRSWVLTTPT